MTRPLKEKNEPLPVMPNALLSEEAIVGSCLEDNSKLSDALEYCATDDFFSPVLQTAMRIMENFQEGNIVFDAVLVASEFIANEEFTKLGGIEYLNSLPKVPNLKAHAQRVHEKWLNRRRLELHRELMLALLSGKADATQTREQAEAELAELDYSQNRRGDFKSIKTVSTGVLHETYKRGKSGRLYTGLETGFTHFDDYTLGLQKSDLILIAARPSMGKLSPMDSVVYTESGKSLMRDIKPGSKIIGFDGKSKLVTHIFPQGIKDIYRVNFSDGTSCECGLEHLWYVESRRDRQIGRKGTVKTLGEIIPGIVLNEKKNRLNYSIPYIKPVEFLEQKIQIPPYLLGALIADGSLSKSNIGYTKTDKDIVLKVKSLLSCNELKPTKNLKDYRINKSKNLDSVYNELNRLGLLGKKSYEKFIPDEYLYNSVENRLELMRGLFDGDGHIQKTGWIEYSTSSEILAENVRQLVLSFGGRASIQSRIGCYTKNDIKTTTRTNYRVRIKFPNQNINPFYCSKKSTNFLNTKVKNLPKFIKSVEYVGKKQAQCILIDCPEHLYATDDYILTHNSAFVINIAENVALSDPDSVVAVFSLEMSVESLTRRMLSSQARIHSTKVQIGDLTTQEWARMLMANRKLEKSNIEIDEETGITVVKIRRKLRKLVGRHKGRLDLIIIDYLQLMEASKKAESRQQEITQISRELKGLAREFKCPLIALSQLSRSPENRANHKPQLSDLRESGSLEQDADVVAFIYREEYYDPTNEAVKNLAELIIAKQRNGAVGSLNLCFHKEYTRFENLIPVSPPKFY